MNLISDIWFQVQRHLRTQIRMKIWIFINLIQPIVWLVLFTQVFRSLSDMFATLPGLSGISYLQFFAPGVVVMTVMFGSAWAGFGMLHDIDMGILSKMLATPVTRISIISSRVLASMVLLVIQALIIFTIAVIMGVDIATGVPGVLFSIAIVSLLGLGFAAFSNGLALLFKRPEPLMGVINFFTLPTMFLSSTMMPSNLLPGWLDTARQFNPVDYAVVGVRDLVLRGYIWDDLWKSLLVLAAWAAVGIAFGTLMFRRSAE
ncbi:MAG: ABC transporter permease [Planctomycetota bacterium]|jgi:ABC-2 type transport system permease protein